MHFLIASSHPRFLRCYTFIPISASAMTAYAAVVYQIWETRLVSIGA